MSKKLHIRNTRKAWITLGLLALCSVADAGYSRALAQNDGDVGNRIDHLENEVQTLSRAIYKGEEPPPGAFSGGADTANLSARLDQLETQIRDLTGKVEELGNQNNQLKSQMDRMSGDFEMRLNNAANNANSNAGGPPRYTAIPPVETPPNPGNILQPPPAPESGPNGAYQWSSDNSNSENDGEPPPPSGSVPNDAGAAVYESAFSLLKNGQYDAAEQGFQGFLDKYPNHTLAGNAKYWLGETYYARGQFDKASRTFAEAYQQYPKGPKAPDNLLKLGLSLAGMGKKEDACIALGQIEKDFATTAGPVLRRAKQEMTNFGC